MAPSTILKSSQEKSREVKSSIEPSNKEYRINIAVYSY